MVLVERAGDSSQQIRNSSGAQSIHLRMYVHTCMHDSLTLVGQLHTPTTPTIRTTHSHLEWTDCSSWCIHTPRRPWRWLASRQRGPEESRQQRMSQQTSLGTLHNYSGTTRRHLGDEDGRSNAKQYKMCDTLTAEERTSQWWSNLLGHH